ncbi:MAG: HAMP domain-containing histidine kinase [Desmonostoc vinosum HA7617-LM4]|jgi:signal transduction histidine kinase|nr:HAMP domain-containing histidine kinase [Desmonostoc vinosum HA7617-LM4]
MFEYLQNFLTDSSFIPHGHCYLWKPSLVWLNIISDSLIAVVYYSIPVILVYFVHKREDLPFKWILLLFGAFIVSCGTTHIMDVWTLWHPTYWLSSFIKAITAIVSLYTAIALLPIIPQALALPSPAQLEAANCQLKLALEELANMQSQLIQTEKMSSLGQLVAGIAHEINNPINFIYGNTTLVDEYTQNLLNLIALYQEYYPHPAPKIHSGTEEIDITLIKEDLPEILSSIKMGADRIRKLVLALRNFSRLDESDRKEVDIHEGIDSILLILQNSLKYKGNMPAIQVIKKYGDLPKIECYPRQINQVFINILTYTINDLKDSLTGCPIAVIGTNITDNQQLVNRNPLVNISTEAVDSNQVIIRISNNGCGLTEDVREKIFEPIVPSKSVSLNTGMGMQISSQIINNHGGLLKCISAPLQGTEIVIQLPIHLKPS